MKSRVTELWEGGVYPKIVSVVLDDSPATAMYVNLKQAAAQRVGIGFETIFLATPEVASVIGTVMATSGVDTDEVVRVLREVGERDDVTGLWVQLPLPAEMNASSVLSALPVEKDIDCLNPLNLGRLLFAESTLMPATVRAVTEILRDSQIKLIGKRVVVVGASPWLGKPLSIVLSNLGATVTMVWETETKLSELTRQADVLISAVGRPKLITAEMLKEGAVVIDVGVSRVNDKVVGDVDFENVKNVAGIITPVPGGVGPLTVVSLLENCLDLMSRP